MLSWRLVPLALTVLAPVIVNIVALCVFLAPFGPGAHPFVAIEILLARSYWLAFGA